MFVFWVPLSNCAFLNTRIQQYVHVTPTLRMHYILNLKISAENVILALLHNEMSVFLLNKTGT